MDIIIVGGGKIGLVLAKELSLQHHDVVLIDTDLEVIENASNRLDANCLHGNGMHMDTLKEAGISEAELLIAVTGNDELNIIICVMAKSMGVANTVSRIRNPEYNSELEMFKSKMGIDRIINPEYEAAVEISRLLALPVANRVDAFANERVEIIEYTIEKDDLIVGKSLAQLSIPPNVLFCAAERDGHFMITRGDYICQEGDNIYLSGTLMGLNNFFKYIGHMSHKAKNIMIVGGSRMAVYLARMARKMNINVRLIERDPKRCLVLAEMLDDCLIINGDGTDEEVLLSEDLKKMDAFITLTDSDEENLLTAFYAKKQGVIKVIPKINRENYMNLTESLEIESVIAPRIVIADHMMRYVDALKNTKNTAMKKLYRIAGDNAEAIEFIVPQNSIAVGKSLDQLNLKQDILIAGLVRGKEVIIPTGKVVIKAKDQVLIFGKKGSLYEFDDIIKG